MDDKRFDLLTKSLSSGISRRSLLRSLAAAVGVAAVGTEVASAAPGGVNGTKKCYGSGSLCTNAKQCCSGMCINRVCAPEVDLCATKNCDDGNDCTIDSCVAGSCTHTPVNKGTPCGPGGWMQCDATGQCVPPLMCNPGTPEECYSGDPSTYMVGICKSGTHVCDPTGMGWGPCIDEVLPSQEICGSGLDEDCNGVVDNGCGGEPCMVATDCQYMDTACQTRTCIDQICGFAYTAEGTLLPPEQQSDWDCKVSICDGAGNVTWTPDDNDLPPVKPCVPAYCKDGEFIYSVDPAGTPCVTLNGENGQCDQWASCVPASGSECQEASDCGSNTDCLSFTCTNGFCHVGSTCGTCSVASECGVDQECYTFVCTSGLCDIVLAAPGTPCGVEGMQQTCMVGNCM